jgi:two-component system sensor histidine kinase MprB
VVADHGPGIPGEDLPRIFDRFYRSPHARSSPGSGLGLAIVRKVVEEHGGSVTAECGDDGGTVMRMTIPESKSLSADGPRSQGPQSAASVTDTP